MQLKQRHVAYVQVIVADIVGGDSQPRMSETMLSSLCDYIRAYYDETLTVRSGTAHYTQFAAQLILLTRVVGQALANTDSDSRYDKQATETGGIIEILERKDTCVVSTR